MSGAVAQNRAETAAVRSPKEIIELYWEEVWNKGNVELIREICADPIVRHDIGSVTLLSHDEQVRRVKQQIEAIRPYFTHEVLNADDQHVTSVWNMVSRGGETLEICGIETFRAENGRFTDCWNAPYSKGRWGRLGDASVAEDLPPPEFLSSIDAIDHTWLQKMFKAADVEVPRVAMVTRIERVGNGTTSDVARLHFGYNADAEGYPHTLIAKFAGRSPEEVADLLDFVGYEREVAAYRFFGPDTPFRIPRCYFAEYRPGGSFNLVLEDMTKACRSGDQIKGCSVTDATAVVREFAALHTRYWKNPEVAAFEWLIRPAQRAAALSNIYAAGAVRMRERYANELGEGALAIIDSVVPLVEPWSRATPSVATLIHGEPRVDNVIFEDKPEGVRACLIDLQQITLGDPVFDLAYFLTGSLDPQDRASCERQLVRDHAKAVQQVEPGYDAEDSWERYRQNAISGLISTVAAAMIVQDTPHNDQLLVALARRNCAAITDLDGIEAAKRKISAGS